MYTEKKKIIATEIANIATLSAFVVLECIRLGIPEEVKKDLKEVLKRFQAHYKKDC